MVQSWTRLFHCLLKKVDKKVKYFRIFQKTLHFYQNSAILFSYYREIFQNFDVQFDFGYDHVKI